MRNCSKCKKETSSKDYCRDCRREYQRQYYKENTELMRQRARDYFQKNPEKCREARRKSQAKNPEAKAVRDAKYYPKKLIKNMLRHHRLQSMDCDWGWKEWTELKNFFGNKCIKCGLIEIDILLTVDHVVPISLGGSNLLKNLQPLCKSCNSTKNATIADYRYV